MIVIIDSEESIFEYFKTIGKEAGAEAVWFIDEGMDAEQRTKDYFTNHYEGLVLMVGLYESRMSDISRLLWDAPQIEFTVLDQYEDENNPESILKTRSDTKTVLHKLLSYLKRDHEDTHHGGIGAGNNGTHWRYSIANNGVVHPITFRDHRVKGWSIDLEVGYPVTEKGLG